MALTSYQAEFIDFLLQSEILRFGDFTLKSGRPSPYFLNIGECNDGDKINELGLAYAQAINEAGTPFDVLFGPAMKGIPLATITASKLATLGINIGFAFNRLQLKEYGEATGADFQKQNIIGATIKDGDRIAFIDDVMTTGATKYDAWEITERCANDLEYPLLIIAANREEVGIDGQDAVAQFSEKTGIPVIWIIGAADIITHLRSKADFDQNIVERMIRYLRVYGTLNVRGTFDKAPEQRIVGRERSVVPACDIPDIERFGEIVKQTAEIEGIGGYKIGFELGLRYGLSSVVDLVKSQAPDKAIIYDHQKAGTDIPDTGKGFVKLCKEAGVDAIIIFPQSGPETERAWIYQALDVGLKVIVGGRMTHPAYSVSEGGWITDEGAMEMYRIAARAGVDSFVVPGNKPDIIAQVREIVIAEGIANPVFFAPGFVAQGGKIEEAAKVAGNSWHAITGRAIINAPDIRQAAIELTSKLDQE